MEKAILVGIEFKNSSFDEDYSLDELETLALSVGYQACHKIIQSLDKEHSLYYVGSGKIDEIAYMANDENIDAIIFDDELSPLQYKNLTERIPVKILDRTHIILEIFNQRATSAESKMELELARLKYQMPRISLLREGLDRQGLSRGKGESQLELDKRKTMADINKLEKRLAQIHTNKQKQVNKYK